MISPSQSPETLKRPALSIGPLNKRIRLRAPDRLEVSGIPDDLFARAQCHIAQKRRFGQCARIIEIACGQPVRLAGLDPFPVVADGIRDEGVGVRESGVLLLGQ